jgi:hypothetical protein
MTTPNDLPNLLAKPVHEQYPDWTFAPMQVGWTATQVTANGHIHVVGAPTLIELRQKLAEVTSRKARP